MDDSRQLRQKKQRSDEKGKDNADVQIRGHNFKGLSVRAKGLHTHAWHP
jgi:hypothetical protein